MDSPEKLASTVLPALDRRIAFDQTDILARVERGRWLAQLGRDDQAAAAYQEAAALPAAVWQDLLRASALLDSIGATAPAAITYQRGLDGMKAAHVRPERQQSLIAWKLLDGFRIAQAVVTALEAADVERVHHLESKMWEIAPFGEGADLAWPILARWFVEHGRPDLASVWKERGEKAAHAYLNSNRRGLLARLEMVGPLMGGMLIAILVAALLVGIRSAHARAARIAQLGKAGGPRWWPRFRWHDMVLVGAPLAIAVGLGMHFQRVQDEFMVSMMSPASEDSFGSPDMLAMLEELPSSEARDELLTYAKAENAAASRGSWHDGEMPSEATIAAAFDGAGRKPFRTTFENADQSLLMAFGSLAMLETLELDNAVAAIIALLLPLALAFMFTTLFPRFGHAVSTVIPGGAARFGAGSGVLIGLVAAALLVLFAVGGSKMTDMHSFARYYGLDAIWHDVRSAAPRLLSWVILAAITGAQLLSVRGRSLLARLTNANAT
jgi:hypothetical protein